MNEPARSHGARQEDPDGFGDVLKRVMDQCKADKPRNLAIEQRVDRMVDPLVCSECAVDLPLLRLETIHQALETPVGRQIAPVYQPCPNCNPKARARWEASGVPANLVHCHFGNWTPVGDVGVKALAAARELVRIRKGFLVLISKDLYGVGKSHLAVAALKAMGRGRFISQSGFLTKLRNTYRNDHAEDIIEVSKRARIFVLDEFGFSGGGRDEFPAIYDVMSHRYTNKLPTIITGNLSGGELVDALGPRLSDRIREAALGVFSIKGSSQRAEKRDDYFK